MEYNAIAVDEQEIENDKFEASHGLLILSFLPGIYARVICFSYPRVFSVARATQSPYINVASAFSLSSSQIEASVFFASSDSSLSPEMKVIAAYLLAALGGKTDPSAADIQKILGSVGAEADSDRIELFLGEVKGKDLAELIAAGREKLASVPAGGGVAVAMPASGGGGGAAAAAPAEEAKKEEKAEEKEESDEDMGFSLFD
ncbi:hypothetical protein H6P81_013673 [Aristolochia fimbriata]|uniref:60S acidic ribosomal protein P2 n=1 Tax=Aristolochia fimbriata TaxID=158543 RepID=A0AAV7EFD1_ARIFI|nr:hypothetical protein H6P81_013673 [Aristolochia fimbriata]